MTVRDRSERRRPAGYLEYARLQALRCSTHEPTKKRLTITVDSALAQAVADAVAAGDADSVSSWRRRAGPTRRDAAVVRGSETGQYDLDS